MNLATLRKLPVLLPLLFAVAILLGLSVAYAVKQSSPNTASGSSCDGTCVALTEKGADPDIVTVTTGSFVQFNSADGKKYSIALEHAAAQHDDDSEFHSNEFGKGEAYRVQFKKDGSYTFRDEFNPKVRVTVIAYTEGKDYKVD